MNKAQFNTNFKIKSIDDSGTFSGLGSVFGNKDAHYDIMVKGAFKKTLEQRMPKLLWQHKMDEPIGVWTKAEETEEGLYLEGKLLIEDDPLAKRAYAHLKAGSLDGLSIGGYAEEYNYDKTKEGWLIENFDLFEVSLVTFPANEQAIVQNVKYLIDKNNFKPSEIEKALRDVMGFSIKEAKAFMSKGLSGLRDVDDTELNQSLSNLLKSF